MSVRHVSTRKSVLALAVLASLHGVAAFAADTTTSTNTKDKGKQLEAVSVVASGSTRQVQSISQVDIKAAPPGTSALKVLNELPGVNFQSSDPWGAYEWSTQITLHGFDQSRLGFTLDGIPLGNMSYAVTNGLQITRAITSDNIASVELAQGAGALGTASSSNLGGTVQFFSDDPTAKAGARINQMVGSEGTHRTFVRFDSGDYHGFSAYLSYDHADTNKWKGYGDQLEDQLNLKGVYQWGDGNRISAYFDSSKRKEYDYQDLSLTSQKVLGWNFDYLQPKWGEAVQLANAIYGKGSYPSQFSGLPSGYDVGDVDYYAGGGIRHDNLGSLSGQFNLGGGATLNVVTYYHSDRGEGQWVTPYVQSSATVPLAMRTTDYGLDRTGGTATLDWTIANNDIEVGVWGEHANNNEERNYFYLQGAFTYLTDFYANELPFERGFFQNFVTDTKMAYIQDTLHFMDDRLTVNFGTKALNVETTAKQLVETTSYAAGRIEAKDNFLPQAGVDYKLDEHQDVYFNYSKNIDAYGYTPFETSQAAFDESRNTLKPEGSQTFELGYRTHIDNIEASVDGYYTHFTNRLLAVTPCSAVETCAEILNNVGSVKSKGVDLALIWRPLEGLRWLNSVSYDNSKYENNYEDDGTIATAGKYVVGVPSWMYTSSVNYGIGRWSFNMDGKYTGRRYITYINDSAVPAYWLFNGSINYDVGKYWELQDVSVGFNVANIFNKRYFATTGTNGYVASDPEGVNQTLQAGAPRQFFFNVQVQF